MTQIKFGAIKYKSIKAAVASIQKRNPGMSYMTAYMRIRSGKSVGSALQKPVRAYARQVAEGVTV